MSDTGNRDTRGRGRGRGDRDRDTGERGTGGRNAGGRGAGARGRGDRDTRERERGTGGRGTGGRGTGGRGTGGRDAGGRGGRGRGGRGRGGRGREDSQLYSQYGQYVSSDYSQPGPSSSYYYTPYQSEATYMQQQPIPNYGHSSGTQYTPLQQNVPAQQQQRNQQQEQWEQATTRISSKLSDLILNKFSLEIETNAKFQTDLPRRQNINTGGTIGKNIFVLANVFKIIFNKDFVTNAVHYDVNIESDGSNKFPKRFYREVFEKCRNENFPNRYPAFDGRKNAYSAEDLFSNDEMTTNIIIKNCFMQCDKTCDKHSRTFTIAFKKVTNIDLSWLRNPGADEADNNATQVLDIIIRHGPESDPRYKNIGRSLFWKLDDPTESELVSLGDGLSFAKGGFLSTILGQKMYLNIDVVYKAFRTPQKVNELMKEFKDNRSRGRGNIDYTKVNTFLKGAKIMYRVESSVSHKSRTYTLNGLHSNYSNSKEIRFNHNNKETTLLQYFKDRYEYRLINPNLPCLSAGAPEKQNYLPAECCTILTGQSVKKLNKTQSTSMTKEAAVKPSDRKIKIMQTFSQMEVNNRPTMNREFHLSVESEMEIVKARVLPPPMLQYAKANVSVEKGTWHSKEFKQSMNLRSDEWGCLYHRTNNINDIKANEIDSFLAKFPRIAKQVGMVIEIPIHRTPLNLQTDKEGIKKFFSIKNLKLILVVLPFHEKDTVYNKIKQIAELEIGVLTQCIKYEFVKYAISDYKLNPIISNILLKINAKLNGTNYVLQDKPKCLEDACMLVGADVTHPSHDETTPSIAAVTASHDLSGFKYNVILKLLKAKEEIISDFEEIIKSQLFIYKERTNCLPKRIIYFRDGVSDGQFRYVIYYEVEAMKRACKAHKIDIQITCIIVQKRHHVRLFPNDTDMNVETGTIVDTEITHPNHIDFYLVSHPGLKGTSKPTKYRCIYNESNFTINDLEKLTFYFCHMYARCTRAVSYPAPTYYAHHAAYRGKALIYGRDVSNLEFIQKEFNKKMMHSPMYFV